MRVGKTKVLPGKGKETAGISVELLFSLADLVENAFDFHYGWDGELDTDDTVILPGNGTPRNDTAC